MSLANESERQPVNSKASAFPVLDDDISQLPLIPGGWKTEMYSLGENQLAIYRPADPDLFLDDEDVLAENKKRDYMPFWAFLWPAAEQMAQAIQNAPWSAGSSVLELGSGIGLVGLAAMKRGDQVTFSDYDPTALHVCRLNAAHNSLPDPPVLLLDWREPVAGTFDVIIGCEVTYDAPMHTVILDLCDRMLAEQGVCWLGDPGRYQSPFFYQMAQERGYSVKIFDAGLKTIDVPSSAGFQIFEMRKQLK